MSCREVPPFALPILSLDGMVAVNASDANVCLERRGFEER